MKRRQNNFRANARALPAVLLAVLGCFACLVVIAPSFTLADAPPLEDDPSTPMVRGAMGEAHLKKNQAQTFSFAADGLGLLTLCWTQPGEPHLIKITDPAGKPVALGGGKTFAVKGHYLIRTLVIRLTKPGIYQLKMSALQDTQLHLGYAWMPMKELSNDNIKAWPAARPIAIRRDDQTPHLLIPSHQPRDTNHWLEGETKVPLGHVIHGASPSGIARRYHMPVEEPGVLTLAVRSKEKSHMAIEYRSHAHDPMIKGHIDHDLYGSPGAEQTEVLIPGPDNLLVKIDPQGGGEKFSFTGSWLSLHGMIEPTRAAEQQ